MVPRGGDVKTLNYEGVSAMLPDPTATSLYNFRENTFMKSNFANNLRNIYLAKYMCFTVCTNADAHAIRWWILEIQKGEACF